MKRANCPSDPDLTLLYYGELADTSAQDHLAACPDCRARYENLKRILDNLTAPESDVDPHAGTRMAARIRERLDHRRSGWKPLAGAALGTALALVVFLLYQPPLVPQSPTPIAVHTMNNGLGLEDDMPDIDFLKDLELLKELDTLRQIEGV